MADKRPELTYDGHGINGPDEYRTRLFTANVAVDAATRDTYGKLCASAPDLLAQRDELLAACKAMCERAGEVMRLCQRHNPRTGYYEAVDGYEVLKLLQSPPFCIDAVNAIAKAEPK
jgi:hypothetical protein